MDLIFGTKMKSDVDKSGEHEGGGDLLLECNVLLKAALLLL
jgi:hypothetical protein